MEIKKDLNKSEFYGAYTEVRNHVICTPGVVNLGDVFSGESSHAGTTYCTQIQGKVMENPTYGPMMEKQYKKHLADWGPGSCESKGFDSDMYHETLKVMGGMTISVWGK